MSASKTPIIWGAWPFTDFFILARKQYVAIRTFDIMKIKRYIKSNCLTVLTGPLVFVLYLEDINKLLERTITLYADDSSFLVGDTQNKSIENKCNSELNELNSWFSILESRANQLCSFPPCSDNVNINRHSNSGPIERKEFVSFREIELDENLNWKTYLDHILAKLNSIHIHIQKYQKYIEHHQLISILVASESWKFFLYIC